MAYGDFKDLHRRTASDKVLYNKAFNFAENPEYDKYQREFASMFASKGQQLILKTNNQQINYAKQSLKNLKNVKCTLPLKIIFVIQTKQIYN